MVSFCRREQCAPRPRQMVIMKSGEKKKDNVYSYCLVESRQGDVGLAAIFFDKEQSECEYHDGVGIAIR